MGNNTWKSLFLDSIELQIQNEDTSEYPNMSQTDDGSNDILAIGIGGNASNETDSTNANLGGETLDQNYTGSNSDTKAAETALSQFLSNVEKSMSKKAFDPLVFRVLKMMDFSVSDVRALRNQILIGSSVTSGNIPSVTSNITNSQTTEITKKIEAVNQLLR